MTNTEFKAGDLVSYYLEGWRVGHYEKGTQHTATISPIGPKGSAPVRVVRVPIEDVKLV